MKILIDIGHPAHVHYFKNLINILKKKNNEFLIIARDKDLTHQLLDQYNIKYISRGKGGKNVLWKLLYLFYANYKILISAIKFQPDIFVSFASIYAAQVSTILQKPHITFTDTEHAIIANMGLVPFSTFIVTPKSFKRNFGKKHKRFDGFFELCYLKPNYFKPDRSVLQMLNINSNEKFIIIRFVSWGASHDLGLSGMNINLKRRLVNKLTNHAKIFISSEDTLPNDLLKYKIELPPKKIHDIMAYASYFIGESGTMAAESGILGVPAIQISGLPDGTIGTLSELYKKYGLIKVYENYNDKIINEIIDNINDSSFYKKLDERKNKMLNEKIDVTDYMIKLIEGFT